MKSKEEYRLTAQVKIHGWSCKLGPDNLTDLLASAGLQGDIEDAAIVPVPNTDIVQVKSLDVFTPIVDEPEVQGCIAAANVTSDIFAMNVPEISGMLVFLAIQNKTPMSIAEGILKGIKFFMEKKINSQIVGGHTIYSKWPLIGGEASGFVKKKDIIPKQGVRNGDQLILTKPIGIQGVMAAYRLLKDAPEFLEKFSESEIKKSIKLAIEVMTTPNQGVIKTIHSYDDFSFIHAMTDVTGFGLAGHTKELLQNSDLSANLTKIPYITLAKSLSEELGYSYDDCTCHETAGGLLLSIDKSHAEEFSNTLHSNHIKNWNVGSINKSKPGHVHVSDEAEHLEIKKL